MALMDKIRSFMGYDDEDYEDEYEYEVEENRALAPRKVERARTAEILLRAAADRQGLELKLRRNPKTQS